jgi:hypothetical protein
MSELRSPERPFASLPGNGTAKRAVLLLPLTDGDPKTGMMEPYLAAASSAAEIAFLAAVFTQISFDDAQEYLHREYCSAIAMALNEFRREWPIPILGLENEFINIVSNAFYWRIDQLARSPGLGGRA